VTESLTTSVVLILVLLAGIPVLGALRRHQIRSGAARSSRPESGPARLQPARPDMDEPRPAGPGDGQPLRAGPDDGPPPRPAEPDDGPPPREGPGGRPFPVAAAVLSVIVLIPSVAQGFWPGLLRVWQRDPGRILDHGEWWRVVTAVVVQDGGLPGTVSNLVALALVGTLATWFWGTARTLAIFAVGGVALNIVATLAGGPVGAGNSAATLALGGGIAGYGVVRCAGRLRAVAAVPIVAGVVIGASGNGHGLAVVAGAALGALLTRWVRIEDLVSRV
jgi:hypothetical protein